MNSIRRIYAPWTPEQVTALNAYQRAGRGHPFTCDGEQHLDSPPLVAYTDGWRCPQPDGKFCDYRQDWAPTFMIPTSKEGGPLPAGKQAERRAAVSAKLWEVAEQHIMAEWVCCEPLDTRHPLCDRGYAALGMVQTLLVDSDPGVAWNPAAPVLDAVMGMLAKDTEEVSPAYARLQAATKRANEDAHLHAMQAVRRIYRFCRDYHCSHIPTADVLGMLGMSDREEEVPDTGDDHSCAESGCSGELTVDDTDLTEQDVDQMMVAGTPVQVVAPPSVVEVPLEAFRRMVKIAMWVSRGRSFAYTPDPNIGTAYPDAMARYALGVLHDAGLLPLADGRDEW